MSAEEYEAAFHGIELPEQVQLFPGAFVPDIKRFIACELEILRNNRSQRVLDSVAYRLDHLLKIIDQQYQNS